MDDFKSCLKRCRLQAGLTQKEAAARLEQALAGCSVVVTGDRTGATCRQYTDALLQML